MTLLNANNLSKYYGAELIFHEVSFQIARGEKVAIVGMNGAGKSTLLRIIAGHETPDSGSLSLARGTRVAYLAQETRFLNEDTLWQAMEAALAEIQQWRRELAALETRLADTNAPDWEAVMERYGELSARFEHAGGYEIEQRIERVLYGLGFQPDQFHRQMGQFSGGQKTRAALAAALLSDPDLLLLDEPTNHLDMQALEWLEQFLRTWDGTLIVVSHDRYFLERVTKRTLELSFNRLEDYPGSYEKYLALKAERMERRLKEYKAQQEFIARTEEFIRRYKAGQRAREAKGREKRLERLKREQMIERPKEAAKLRVALDSQLRSGELVLRLDGVVVGYQVPHGRSNALLQADDLTIRRGERVGLLGPNGAGKTTLLRTLIGQLPPLQGIVRFGHEVRVSYYAQGHDVLQWDNTVLAEVLRVAPSLGEGAARNLLARFLFTGDDVFKRIADLSGGERSRVALAQLTLLPGNMLLLDEPTNHLDIDAREALEAVLKEYTGTILFVSHDRYFIDALADKLWIIEQGRIRQFVGNYSDYIASQQAVEPEPTTKPVAAKATPAKPPRPDQAERAKQRRLAALEAEVTALEQDLARLSSELDAASQARDIARLTALGAQYAELERLLADKYAQWEQLAA
ncbi:ABC-F family ATP-binding cassette domain-containing protein [Chloroflexus aggregans]|uniref:ABC transporter related n=1 Tax=Chloroflexus aggregans (strain MD-66 / DSM 9485) TaxID=326427 RepID=B8GA28_CHLAD|nr:ABC-F family ATP-binding cassette domain-containing protein [Chloroflexus aggregans]ACL24543.1 ABC transporter related [Chloroflexus aggregans DSM 9485]